MALLRFKHRGLVVCIWPDPSEQGAAAVESFSKAMKAGGYRVKDAVSTPQGIKLIAGGRPDLVFVHADPSTMITLSQDRNFAAHYQPKPGADTSGSVLFERRN